ncbi:MAG: hypothetical protein J6Y12_05245 [Lachnospiraceae bacterium]|nr:hypothetical protein [Lachnospiraceae bacterium]
MRSRNTGHPLPSINGFFGNRHTGKIEYVMGMYALLFVLVMAMVSLQILRYKADSDIAEDALAASCLAALDVDPYRYGTDHCLVINDPVHARQLFEEALRDNMRLEPDMTYSGADDFYITGKVNIDDFRIYTVDGDNVTEYAVSGYGIAESTGVYGSMKTPSGLTVRSAGAYAKISFDTYGIFDVRIRACKEAYAEMLGKPFP